VEIEKLKHGLTEANIQLDSSQQLNDLIGREKAEFEALALAMDEESRALAEQAKAHEAALKAQQQDYENKLKALQSRLTQQDDKAISEQR
jgi:type I restriction enzyme R subunit